MPVIKNGNYIPWGEVEARENMARAIIKEAGMRGCANHTAAQKANADLADLEKLRRKYS